LLVQTGREDAIEVAERIRAMIDDMEIQFSENTFRSTVSIGLTTTTDGEISVEEIIKKADQALYNAKNSGRNQVSVM
jgi:diguanylate cyclase (GGDEF)-like protein